MTRSVVIRPYQTVASWLCVTMPPTPRTDPSTTVYHTWEVANAPLCVRFAGTDDGHVLICRMGDQLVAEVTLPRNVGARILGAAGEFRSVVERHFPPYRVAYLSGRLKGLAVVEALSGPPPTRASWRELWVQPGIRIAEKGAGLPDTLDVGWMPRDVEEQLLQLLGPPPS